MLKDMLTSAMKTRQHAQHSNIQFYVFRSTSGLTCWETHRSNQSSILVAQTVTPGPRMCPVERSVKLLPGSFLSMQMDWNKSWWMPNNASETNRPCGTNFYASFIVLFCEEWNLGNYVCYRPKLKHQGEFSTHKRQCTMMTMTASVESS